MKTNGRDGILFNIHEMMCTISTSFVKTTILSPEMPLYISFVMA